uniref:Probable threonylcarbamoyladenosine tRNA methylthiotransferase n=1 Tax=uncultured marine thaumarchaeote AD1000_06_A03 TaxID=1455884 RepID=A0A075FI09_9ARCH|nr:RNA modification enzyme, MiaB family (miaB) [uncultured marine thaumarchaeote AD1000_06_A03]
MNVHDSERIAGLLEQAGYEITQDLSESDLAIINTCSVRERAEDKLLTRLENMSGSFKDGRPTIAVTGCVAQQEGANLFKKNKSIDVVIGTHSIKSLPLLVAKASSTGLKQLDINPYDDVSFPLGIAVRKDPVKAFVTIIEGCNDFCSFCVVPYTRGKERMRPLEDILAEIRCAVSKGHCEIQLLGQIVNHYQAPDSPGCDFSSLLERVHEIPGVKRIRFASPHPRHVTPRMISIMRDLPMVCKHMHLPVQSGSTRTLASMRRRYTREEYLSLVSVIRKTVPDVSLSTDLIVGFPGESLKDFEETLSLVRSVRFHSIFSFKYSERPNTLASKRMPNTVSEVEKNKRLVQLQALQKKIQLEINQKSVGGVVEVLVDSRSRKRTEELSGRTSQNVVVNFPGKSDWIGRMLKVTVKRAGPNSLWGEAVN